MTEQEVIIDAANQVIELSTVDGVIQPHLVYEYLLDDQIEVELRGKILAEVNKRNKTKWSLKYIQRAYHTALAKNAVEVDELHGTAPAVVGQFSQTNQSNSEAEERTMNTNANRNTENNTEVTEELTVQDSLAGLFASHEINDLGHQISLGVSFFETKGFNCDPLKGQQVLDMLASEEHFEEFELFLQETLAEMVSSDKGGKSKKKGKKKGKAESSSKDDEVSRYSFFGTNDSGIRASWVAAGAAIIGGGIEMATRGGVSIAGAVGTVAGAVGGFFAGELIEEKLESRFGSYVAAGTAGMVLGGVGAAAGRMVSSSAAMPFSSSSELDNEPTAPAVTPEMLQGAAAMLSR